MPKTTSKFSLLSDEELMFCLSSGEVLAFDEIYFRYSKRLLGYFIRMLNFDKNLAEDALQDLFLKIAEAPEKFDNSRSFKTWIFSVASNSCKNFYRHKKIVSECNEEIKYINGNVTDSAFLITSSKMDAVMFRKMLEEVLNALSAEKKEAFILKYQEEKTIAEIALIQGCPEGSVKSRLHYTIKVLEEKLKIFKPINC
jgi:RNA polymerase sigma-70 factor (ECF subfamily)